MIGKSKKVVVLGLAIASLHAVVVFGLIPAMSARLRPLYNQNRYADGYDELATNLAQGHGYRFYPDTARTLMREPGYPLFLAGIFRLTQYSFTAVKIANMLLALATAVAMTLIARGVLKSEALMLAPALLFLFHPGTLIAESRGGAEMLFACFLTLFILTVYKAIETGTPRYFLISGFALGLTAVVRSTPLLFPAALLLYLVMFCRHTGKWATCRNVLVMVLAMFSVLTPWIIRNYRITHKFVPTASVLGISAHAGQYICSHLPTDNWARLDREAAEQRKNMARSLGYPFKEVKDAYYEAFYSSNDELKFSSFLLDGVLAEYKRSPLLFAKAVGYNLFNLWFAGKTREATQMNMVVQSPYLILGLFGAVLAFKRRQFHRIAPMVLLMAYLAAVYAAILAQARYSVPLMPFVSILACIAMQDLGSRWRGHRGLAAGTATRELESYSLTSAGERSEGGR